MKAFLITNLIFYIIALVTTPDYKPVSDGVRAFAQLIRVGMVVWAITLMADL